MSQMSLRAIALAAAFALPVGVRAEPAQIVARAVGKAPSKQVVEFVARNAQPTVFTAADAPRLGSRTIRQIIKGHCGSVQDGYIDEFARLNGLDHIELDAPIPVDAPELKLPACLFASRAEDYAVQYAVTQKDTLTSIRKRFTGAGANDKAAIDKFFAPSKLSSKDAKTLKPGQQLTIPLRTSATVLSPTMTTEEFTSGLSAVTGGGSVDTDTAPKHPGTIVGGVRFQGASAGSTEGTFAACNAGDGSRAYPFDPDEVTNAYAETRKKISASPSRVSVVVVDNGFFGAPCEASACPVMTGDRVRDVDRFPAAFFDYDQFPNRYGYGPALIGTGIQPLNYWNDVRPGTHFASTDVNEESGHGTHVAGLAMGGPTFLPRRKEVLFNPDGKPWYSLVIANISGGQSDLAIGSDRNLFALIHGIRGTKVINMSVAFDAQVDPEIAETVYNTISSESSDLFVAAAGNSGFADIDLSASDEYPARCGGLDAANVITVASIDGPDAGTQHLSAFSNRGAKLVDIAAPGCRLRSWVNAEGPEIEISGTSQATPVVTFAATLLRSLWDAQPRRIKNRLLYAGDLLEDASERDSIASKAQLNIAKAITFEWDRLTYQSASGKRTVLGKLSPMQGVKCTGGAEIKPQNLRSIKRDTAQHTAIYTTRSDQTLLVCWGQIAPSLSLHMHVESEIDEASIAAASTAELDVPSSSLLEVVWSQ